MNLKENGIYPLYHEKSFYQQSAQQKLTSPVFIVGIEHSGSTILYRSLQRCENFRLKNVVEGFDLSESRVFIDPASVYSKSSNAYHYLLEDEICFDRFMASTKNIPIKLINNYGVYRYKTIFRKNKFMRSILWKVCQNHLLVRSYFYFASLARGMTRIVEKTPRQISNLPEIRATFPNARVICAYRHPIDVFHSYLKHARLSNNIPKGTAKSLDWLNIKPDQFCKSYQSSLQQALQESKENPDSFLLIKYEELTSNPDETMKQVLQFLNEPLIPFDFEREFSGVDYQTLDAPGISPIGTKPDTGLELLSDNIVTQIEKQLIGIMKKTGYLSYSGV